MKIYKPRKLNLKSEIEKGHFRVAIYGSARLREGDKVFKDVFNLAKEIGVKGYDIITGGGPGLMEAANAGHSAGDKDQKAESIGLNIQLSFEQKANRFIEVEQNFERFAERLETFVSLSNVFVITPGGVGTMLEFFYTWQLAQVKKIEFKPIILVGEMWRRLIYWVIDYALKDNLLNSSDFDYIYIAKNNKEAMRLINEFHEQYKRNGKLEPIDRDEFNL